MTTRREALVLLAGSTAGALLSTSSTAGASMDGAIGSAEYPTCMPTCCNPRRCSALEGGIWPCGSRFVLQPSRTDSTTGVQHRRFGFCRLVRGGVLGYA
jgi:hypothetical protein